MNRQIALIDLVRESRTEENVLFRAVNFVRPFIDDLTALEDAFDRVQSLDEVANIIGGLRQRSFEMMVRLVKAFCRGAPRPHWYPILTAILFPFLQDQVESRLELLTQFWHAVKNGERFIAPAELRHLSETISRLAELLEQFVDTGAGSSDAPSNNAVLINDAMHVG